MAAKLFAFAMGAVLAFPADGERPGSRHVGADIH